MNILKIPSLDHNKYNEYLKLLDEGIVILNWWRMASELFNKWLDNRGYKDIVYRWWFNQKSQFIDYYYFYKENKDKDDYDNLVRTLVEEDI